MKRNNDTGEEMWRPIPRKDLMSRSDVEIVSTFNSEIRGLYNLYRIVESVGALHKYYYMVRYSMSKTLAGKHRTDVSIIKKRHMINGVLRILYDTIKGRKYCEFYHDGFRKHSGGYDNVADVMPSYRKYDGRHTIISRIKAGVCETCGEHANYLCMHHVRTLKSLKGKDIFEQKMLKMRRKSLALCPDCFELLYEIKESRRFMESRIRQEVYVRLGRRLPETYRRKSARRRVPTSYLMQVHSSYVVTDPKGTILVEYGKMLQRDILKSEKDGKLMKDEHSKVIYEPYRIRVLNTISLKKSTHYNPFAYIHSEKDTLKLVTTPIANTKGEGKAGDDFWVKAETSLYCALIGYIHYEASVEEQNFPTLTEFINAMEVRGDDEEFKNPVDLMLDALEAEKPNHFAVRQCKKYKLAIGKTAKPILISCSARPAVSDIAELCEVTAYDELELDTLRDRKTALFLIMSDTDDSFSFLIFMCYTQLLNLLCEKADDVYGGRPPVHVRCLIDECANIGQIPKLEKLVAAIRSREISTCLVSQTQSQLKVIYKDNADAIIDSMDTSIFLGGKEPTTLKELAAMLGKEAINTYSTGENRGRETSYSPNYQKLGKELMSQDELAVMDGGKCILQLCGVRPFLLDKYDITKHPNFKYTAGADDRSVFDIEAFLSAKLKLKPNEVRDAYEIDTKGA